MRDRDHGREVPAGAVAAPPRSRPADHYVDRGVAVTRDDLLLPVCLIDWSLARAVAATLLAKIDHRATEPQSKRQFGGAARTRRTWTNDPVKTIRIGSRRLVFTGSFVHA